ncbi:hypothetical protein T440DRAFT_558121 [Plenodomus tracheiphilus IPT5]|uniref:Uncharacterized protein n=1 Tax=Plenodomus tracheiphilus IPT5 TaxID=1408161 RepID=A0A6A7AT67_9PLEO|nr:hypothetical protein T440DRAFT_558121 [Plenodomus tracheiphilus IPT5]
MTDHATNSLVNLPLEVRHHIFAFVAARESTPKNLLLYWFEKQDAKQQIAELAAEDPTGPAPRVVYNPEPYDVDMEVSDEEEYEEEYGEEDDEEEEDQEEDDEQADAEDDDEEDEAVSDDDSHQATNVVPTLDSASAQTLAATGTQTAGADQVDDEEGAEEEQDDSVVDDDDECEEQDEASHYADEDAAAVTRPRRPIVRVHHKWRHIPNFMHLTHCPPPVELLLICQQLKIEAKNWFYNATTLNIEATASFAHTSFFEEAFTQITDAAFSPMENIRKVEVNFVWDSTWIRADDTGCIEAIFPALLRQRADFVVKILQQAPDLRDVTVHWHDSTQDDESTGLRLEIYEGFLGLRANIKFEEHYIPEDAKPNRKSIAGRRRVEFQNIIDNGLDRLF